MPEDDDILGALAAVFLGLVGLAILASVFGPKCPKCGKAINREVKICPNCGAVLEW
jgi:predicted amidophosphoribosyltransferase